ncbi:MAG: hypothetical protein ACREPV_03225 [Lysobacter sp.]
MAAVLVYLLLGTYLGTLESIEQLIAQVPRQFSTAGGVLQAAVGIALVALSCGAAWKVSRRPLPFHPGWFLLVMIAGSIALRGILIGTVEPEWSTDYLRYWQRALELASREELRVSTVYHQRALLFAYPVAEIWGADGAIALKWLNAALLLAIQLAVYDVARLARSHQAAQSASILLLAAPIPAYAALIPSHDVWGLFFVALAIWTAVRIFHLGSHGWGRWLRFSLLTALCALALYCLQLQRSIGTILSIALLVAAIIVFFLDSAGPERERRSRLLVVAALACFLAQPLLARVGTQLEIHPTAKNFDSSSYHMKIAAHAGAMGTANSAWYARFADRFHGQSKLGVESTANFAESIAVSNWVLEPTGKLRHLKSHMSRLFRLGYPAAWNTTLRRPADMSGRTRNSLVFHAGVFGVAFGCLLLFSLYRSAALLRSMPLHLVASLVFVAGLSLLLLALFENKPYNIFPIWLCAVWLISWVASHDAARGDKAEAVGASPAKHRSWPTLLAGICTLVVGAATAWAVPRALYTERAGLVLDDWDLSLAQDRPPPADWRTTLALSPPDAFDKPYYVHDRRSFVLKGATEDGKRIHKYANGLFTTLEFPTELARGDRFSMERKVCGIAGDRHFEFFVFAPFQRRDVDNAFTLEVLVDGMAWKQVPIPYPDGGNTMRRVSLDDPLGGGQACHSISIELVSNVNQTAESWRRASHVEIWFPRLVPAMKITP